MDELRSDRLVDGVALDNLTAGDGDDDLNGYKALPGTQQSEFHVPVTRSIGFIL